MSRIVEMRDIFRFERLYMQMTVSEWQILTYM